MCPWAVGPEEKAQKPEEGVEAELLSPSCRKAGTQKPVPKTGLAEGARLFTIK